MFLRHLQRTHLLLHVVDFAPFDESVDPVVQAKAIVAELKKYDQTLFEKARWLVLNKMDMVPDEEREKRVKDFVKRYKWKGPVFQISALTRDVQAAERQVADSRRSLAAVQARRGELSRRGWGTSASTPAKAKTPRAATISPTATSKPCTAMASSPPRSAR